MRIAALPFVALALSAQAPAPAPKTLSPGEIVAAAPAGDWVAIAPTDLLVMDLVGNRRVVIQLMPPPFSQGWVGNIRKLAAARFWDATSINRVQDNYVVQWGDADGEDKAKAKELPEGLVTVPETEYTVPVTGGLKSAFVEAEKRKREHFEKLIDFSAKFSPTPDGDVDPAVENALQPMLPRDPYAVVSIHWSGWPLGTTSYMINERPQRKFNAWPVHCYGMVGVGRNLSPDTGTGAELYTVIGHAPRHLDRNIALVGRVISGIEHLSSLPRGTGPLGFYEKPEQRVGIVSVRLGNEVADLAAYQYLSTESATFARYADARANRRDAFFIQPAGGADICNIPVPVRKMP